MANKTLRLLGSRAAEDPDGMVLSSVSQKGDVVVDVAGEVVVATPSFHTANTGLVTGSAAQGFRAVDDGITYNGNPWAGIVTPYYSGFQPYNGNDGTPIKFISGYLPTGLSLNTIYYVYDVVQPPYDTNNGLIICSAKDRATVINFPTRASTDGTGVNTTYQLLSAGGGAPKTVKLTVNFPGVAPKATCEVALLNSLGRVVARVRNAAGSQAGTILLHVGPDINASASLALPVAKSHDDLDDAIKMIEWNIAPDVFSTGSIQVKCAGKISDVLIELSSNPGLAGPGAHDAFYTEVKGSGSYELSIPFTLVNV